jgi:hypothetical protein
MVEAVKLGERHRRPSSRSESGPAARRVPTPRRSSRRLRFAEQLLHAQRQFVERVLAAAAPVLDTSASTEPKKSAAKSA